MPPEFLSTHPVTAARIADTRGRAEQFEPRVHRDSADYPLIRAKLRIRLASTPAAAVEHFAAKVSADGTEAREADRYGLALALSGASRHDEARAILDTLLEEFPDRAAHRTAAADTYSALGEDERALSLLATAVEQSPGHRSLVYGYARALVHAERPDEAAAVLRRFQRSRESDAALYRLLALAHQRAGRSAASHMALAEFHYHNGDLVPAIRQLDIALELPAIGDYRAARAEARRRELREERSKRR